MPDLRKIENEGSEKNETIHEAEDEDSSDHDSDKQVEEAKDIVGLQTKLPPI